jgi:hypothetical protein
MKSLIIFLLLTFATVSNAEVRWNPVLRIWEGNICMNNIGWQVVNWQPLGSLCYMRLPNGQIMQGIIINA